jgi:hypothetical protein
VTCEGGKPYPGLIILLPLQNHRSLGTSPLGLTSLKRKNLPIMVTLGGIGSCYASLAFNLIAFFLATNYAITCLILFLVIFQVVYRFLKTTFAVEINGVDFFTT